MAAAERSSISELTNITPNNSRKKDGCADPRFIPLEEQLWLTHCIEEGITPDDREKYVQDQTDIAARIFNQNSLSIVPVEFFLYARSSRQEKLLSKNINDLDLEITNYCQNRLEIWRNFQAEGTTPYIAESTQETL